MVADIIIAETSADMTAFPRLSRETLWITP